MSPYDALLDYGWGLEDLEDDEEDEEEDDGWGVSSASPVSNGTPATADDQAVKQKVQCHIPFACPLLPILTS